MATPNIVPRVDGEGFIGTSLKKWAKGYFNALFINNVEVLPDITPTTSSIPIADANGKIDSEWIKDASETVKGVVELASPADVLAGEDTERAVTPAGFKAAVDELLNIADPVWGSISGTLSDQTDLQTALDGKASVIQVAPSPLAFSKSTEIYTLGTSVYYSETFSTSKPCYVFANGSIQLRATYNNYSVEASISVDDITISNVSHKSQAYTTKNFATSSGIAIRPGSHTLKVLVSALSGDAYGRNLSATLYFI